MHEFNVIIFVTGRCGKSIQMLNIGTYSKYECNMHNIADNSDISQQRSYLTKKS